jgi:NAD(P)-dependent dehydrogenase (short-subunit alcohol dehydrogenase family)
VSRPQIFHRTTPSNLRAVLETNVVGTALVASAATATMRETGHGRVVMVGSSAGFHGEPGISAYAASKAAVIALARSAAAEGADRDVLCNVLLPFAWTDMSSNGIDPSQADRLRPELIAPVVGALADRECHLNGQVIISAGGLLRLGEAVEGDSVAVPRDDPLTPDNLARLLEISRQAPTRTYRTGQQAFLDLMSDLPAIVDKDRP